MNTDKRSHLRSTATTNSTLKGSTRIIKSPNRQTAQTQYVVAKNKENKHTIIKDSIVEESQHYKHTSVLDNSCFILSDQAQKLTRNKSSTERAQSIKDRPNPTTFSNVRKDYYMQTFKVEMKNSERNQNLKSMQISMGEQVNNPEEIQFGTKSLLQNTLSKQSLAENLKVQVVSKNGRSTTMMGSNLSDQHYDQQKLQSIDNTSSCSSPSSSDHSSVRDEDEDDTQEGNVEVSTVVVTKQIPRVLSSFSNIFQYQNKDYNSTLERILNEPCEKVQNGLIGMPTFMQLSTQAQTYAQQQTIMKGINQMNFEQKYLSPSKVKDAVQLKQIPCKVLQTIPVGDITQSQNNSSFPIYVECSVPEICTNSSIISECQQKNSILSLGNQYFPQDHRDSTVSQPNKVHRNASCLHASYGHCSSQSSSVLGGGSSKLQCSCCHMNSNASNTLRSLLQSKFMINLESVLIQESKLFTLKERLDKQTTWPSTEVMTLCEEWWTVTRDSTCMFDIYKIYREAQTRKILRRAMILECIVIVLTAYYNQQRFSQMDQATIDATQLVLNKLYSAVHDNLMHIICLILQRMGVENCENNVWAVQLKEIVNSKLQIDSPLFLEEFPRNDIIQSNNCILIKQIKALHQHQIGDQILFTNISYLLQELEKTHINRAKDILIQALSHEAQLIQNQNQVWQEYPLEDLECDESIQLPASPQLDQVDIERPMLNQHLSTINEDCSYYTNTGQPYLPPMKQNRQYTLVLDLDETLIHYVETSCCSQDDSQYCGTQEGGQFLVRPGVHKFLRLMAQHYEIVIFTAAMQDYADWVLDQLDIENCISHRLYRQHAIPTPQYYIKDLSRIGRDLSRTLIVDNVAENFQLQPDNGVFIRTWIDDPHDNALEELAPLLKEIVIKGIDDVREALRIFRIQMMEQVQRGIMKPRLSLDINQSELSQ